ncbi:MAG: hypothetical protein BEU02_00765 [Marine Group III euryarchaeote CG-Epi5]|mgnify:FL=1|uniref:Uncharacterized protein n=1 Tax=Marine Group III euryarchaeote CG-Epi5 TaxID=1888999 RepID=A0A1J5TP63_9ARCH|nr:MAG: hypothetical protein BEU02_00765 [Marine Group III euryarchaeote CG-Epi5]
MDLYNSIIITIWLTMLYAVWAATAAGDPGYGQAAFIISGIAGHLYLRKLKMERPVSKKEDIEIPNAEFSVEILEEKDKYVITEKAFRKIIWISTIISLILLSLFLEAITTGKHVLLGILAMIIGLIVFIIPIFLPVKDDVETLRKRAEKERTKAWRKGKVSHSDEEE